MSNLAPLEHRKRKRAHYIHRLLAASTVLAATACMTRSASIATPRVPPQPARSHLESAGPGLGWADGENPEDRLARGARVELDLDSGRVSLRPAAGWQPAAVEPDEQHTP